MDDEDETRIRPILFRRDDLDGVDAGGELPMIWLLAILGVFFLAGLILALVALFTPIETDDENHGE